MVSGERSSRRDGVFIDHFGHCTRQLATTGVSWCRGLVLLLLLVLVLVLLVLVVCCSLVLANLNTRWYITARLA